MPTLTRHSSHVNVPATCLPHSMHIPISLILIFCDLLNLDGSAACDDTYNSAGTHQLLNCKDYFLIFSPNMEPITPRRICRPIWLPAARTALFAMAWSRVSGWRPPRRGAVPPVPAWEE